MHPLHADACPVTHDLVVPREDSRPLYGPTVLNTEYGDDLVPTADGPHQLPLSHYGEAPDSLRVGHGRLQGRQAACARPH